MLKIYLKIALRSILRNKASSSIIIISFALGLACINIISTYVLYEFSTDSFNIKKDRIYRLLADDTFHKEGGTKNILPSVPGIMKAKFPGIEDYCRTGFFIAKNIKAGENEFRSPVAVLEVSPSFFNIFSFKLRIGILLSVLGLFSFALITTKSRTKEISIRKILGSSVNNVVLLLLKDYLKWILLADIISWLITYKLMAKWLQNFAYKIELSWWIFALSGGLVLIIALATVSLQVIKAATANPVESLRYE